MTKASRNCRVCDCPEAPTRYKGLYYCTKHTSVAQELYRKDVATYNKRVKNNVAELGKQKSKQYISF